MSTPSRREFLQTLSLITGSVVLMPVVSACGAPQAGASSQPSAGPWDPPAAPPAGWDAIAYNRDRGNAGFIPESYRDDINGETGVTDHLGKHLPWVPDTAGIEVPAGFLPIMWGNPDQGYARHPNAVPGEANNFEGHWYNWIRVTRVGSGDTVQSDYPEWPGDGSDYAVFGRDDITADSGKNTIYLAALPPGTQSGDTVRIWAHCLTHGEYVDFVVVP